MTEKQYQKGISLARLESLSMSLLVKGTARAILHTHNTQMNVNYEQV